MVGGLWEGHGSQAWEKLAEATSEAQEDVSPDAQRPRNRRSQTAPDFSAAFEAVRFQDQ
jgi:hypothetical protein